jgi:hypothetical protein
MIFTSLSLERFNRIINFSSLLSVDSSLLQFLIIVNEKNSPDYVLHLNGISYPLGDVSITNSPTPVTSPTTRGGVYFSDTFAYKIKGIIEDVSIIPALSKTMLGPNTEFGEIKITTQIQSDNKKINLSIFTNLINSVQSLSKIELNMILVRLESN